MIVLLPEQICKFLHTIWGETGFPTLIVAAAEAGLVHDPILQVAV
jgi:hypothetical protein